MTPSSTPPPHHLEHVTGAHRAIGAIYEALSKFEHEPIYTVYLKYAPAVGIARGFGTLLDDAPKRRYAQWVFDRGALDQAIRGCSPLLVLSGLGGHTKRSRWKTFVRAVAQQLTDDLGLPACRARAIMDRQRDADRRALTCGALPNQTLSPGFAIARLDRIRLSIDAPKRQYTGGRAAARALL